MALMQNNHQNPKLPESISHQKFTCSIYHSFDDIEWMQQEWDSFVELERGDIYLTFDWCRAWWQFYGKGRLLRIFIFIQNKQIIGLLPVFIEKIWLGPIWLKMAKLVGSDFTMSMVNPPVRESFAVEIFHQIINSLVLNEECDALWFGPISEKCSVLQQLRDAVNSHSEVNLLQDSIKSPYTIFLLPETFSGYIQTLKKRQRGNLRRGLNLINRSFQMTQDVIQDETAVSLEFDKFVQMHTVQWEAQGKLGHFNDWPLGVEFNARIATNQARLGRLKLIRLLADGKVVSYNLCYAFGDRWYWRLPARVTGPDWDKFSLGIIGLVKEIEMAISEGVHEIEAGAGHYDYKIKLGGKEHSLHTIMLTRKKLFCGWRAFLFLSFSKLLHFCYYRIWFNRLAPKLPFKRRPLWKLWIRTRI